MGVSRNAALVMQEQVLIDVKFAPERVTSRPVLTVVKKTVTSQLDAKWSVFECSPSPGWSVV